MMKAGDKSEHLTIHQLYSRHSKKSRDRQHNREIKLHDSLLSESADFRGDSHLSRYQ